MENTIKGFSAGIMLGALLGAYFGYQYGVRVKGETLAKPEFRMIIAAVVVSIWALAQLLSILFNTEVDPWLNTIMGVVAGFLFGDGLVESFKGKDIQK